MAYTYIFKYLLFSQTSVITECPVELFPRYFSTYTTLKFYRFKILGLFFIFLGHKACVLLAPQSGIEPTSPTLGGGLLATREAPSVLRFYLLNLITLSSEVQAGAPTHGPSDVSLCQQSLWEVWGGPPQPHFVFEHSQLPT